MKKIILSLLIISLLFPLSGCKGHIEKYELVSLSNNIQINGSFFLGSGSIKGEPVFYYYAKNNNGAIKLSYVYSCKALIYEDLKENELPYVNLLFGFGERYNSITKREFHVPKNSVISTFNLDVSNIK